VKKDCYFWPAHVLETSGRRSDERIFQLKNETGHRPEEESQFMMLCSPFQQVRSCLAISALSAFLGAAAPTRVSATDNRAPDVPQAIQAPVGNKVHFHAFAEGVQIYTWNGASWVFQAPEALLFDGEGGLVAIHFAGPTWQSNSGSQVVGAVTNSVPSPNPNSIPMLLLTAKRTEGPGIFAPTTYVQRINTVGGLAPSRPGTLVGEKARVPYTAEYVFYREEN